MTLAAVDVGDDRPDRHTQHDVIRALCRNNPEPRPDSPFWRGAWRAKR